VPSQASSRLRRLDRLKPAPPLIEISMEVV
jgi:hypothetical protein